MHRSYTLFAILVLPACSSEATGIYHRPGQVDSINLELREDTFRWSVSGCDYFGGAHGRVQRGSDGTIILQPEGRETFLWPGAVNAQVARVRLEISGETLVERDAPGLTWVAGGVCAECGTNMGPSGQKECDEPTFFDEL